jgi:hypothetical protein
MCVGLAYSNPPATSQPDAPKPLEKAPADRFPSVEIVNVFLPEGESNVRSSFKIGNGSALIGTEETGDVYKTEDAGMTWRKTTDGGDEFGIQDIRNIIRAQDNNLYATTSEPALVLQSRDEGESWQQLAKAQSSRTVGIVQLDDGAILVGLRRSENDKISIIRSEDYFETFDWIPLSEDYPRQNVTCFYNLGGSAVLAGIGYEASGKIFKSDDAGLTWRKTGELPDARDLMAFYEEGGVVYVLASGVSTLYSSADAGETWEKAHQFWPKGFIGSTTTFDWNGKTYRVIPGTDQRNKKPPLHYLLISDDLGKTWFEWIELVIDPTEKQGGGVSNIAVISSDTIIVGQGNHAVQGRCFVLKIK